MKRKIFFDFRISKIANFYFFIQNLSEWHFSNRKDYNTLWRSELDSFSPGEERALEKFKKIRSKFKESRTFFEQLFFKAPLPLEELKNHLSLEDFQEIKKVFSLLEPKFNILYERDHLLLQQWQEVLNKKANNVESLKPIVDTLCFIFNVPPPEINIKVYLLFSSPSHSGGGANIDEESISLEISRYPLDDIGQALGIIWHESIHLIFQKHYFYPLLSTHFPQDRSTINLVNEATIGALFPRGILGIRLLKNKPVARLLPQLDSEQTIEVLNLVKEYVDQRKRLDEDYIKRLLLILRKKTA